LWMLFHFLHGYLPSLLNTYSTDPPCISRELPTEGQSAQRCQAHRNWPSMPCRHLQMPELTGAVFFCPFLLSHKPPYSHFDLQ
jgi:hypothetical protein